MLKPKRKIARQELKTDPLLEKIAMTEHFMKEKGKLISYVALGVVVLAVVAIFFINSKKEASLAASGSLGIAQNMLLSAGTDAQREAATEKLDEIINAYPGTKGAGYAVFTEAKALLEQEKYADAEAKLNTFISDYGDDDLLLSAAYSCLAVCKESAGNYAEAARLFEKSSKSASFQIQKETAMLNSVRNLILSNDLGQAELMVKKVLDTTEDDQIKNQAEILAARVEVLKG